MGYIHPLTRCSLVREGVLETLPGMKVNVFLFSLRQACSAGSEEASRDKGLGGGGQQRRGVHRRGIGCEGRCGGLGPCAWRGVKLGEGWADECEPRRHRVCVTALLCLWDVITASGCGTVWCRCGSVRVLGGVTSVGRRPRVPECGPGVFCAVDVLLHRVSRSASQGHPSVLQAGSLLSH